MILVLSLILPKRFVGITIWPFIFVKSKELRKNHKLVNHERIHLRQQRELLVVPFYLWYITEYLIRLLVCRNRIKAYKSICFEREAYTNENDNRYLKKRRFWTFLRYLKNK